jgi:uncharacterized protein YndB with AHSA1/START domain
MHQLRYVCFLSVLLLPSIAAAQERVLRAELDLPASPATVWNLWTTAEGLRSFFAPGARIEPVVDGDFEILFSPDAPKGQRGAEGLRVIGFEPESRFAFTWNAPNELPSIRAQRTVVEIRLKPTASGTHMTFLHWGWGLGPEWDKAYDYFDKAWGGFVLPSLVNRITAGPLDWKTPPALEPLPGSLKSSLTLSPRQ